MRVAAVILLLATAGILSPTGAGARAADPYLIPPRGTQAETLLREGASTPLREPTLLFWNMLWFPGGPRGDLSRPARDEKISQSARLIRERDADLVFLCEVADLDGLRALGLDYPYLACTTIPRPAGEAPHLAPQNLALLSRQPPARTWVLDFSGLPDTPDRPARGILAAQFPRPGGRPLTCYLLHLKSNLGGYRQAGLRRERAIDYLAWDMQRHNLDPGRDPILIVGDMNTAPDHPLYRREQTLRRIGELGFVAVGKRPADPAAMADGQSADAFDHFFLSEALAGAQQRGKAPQAIRHPCPETVSDHSLLELKIR